MRPTIAATPSDGAHPNTPRRVDSTLLELDNYLFNTARWFAIDRDNQRVRGVVVPTLEKGLTFVGHGRVATLVGQLRPGVAAVDVDVPGDLGDLITSQIVDWLTARGLWHLTRPSGGAPGRAHIFCTHRSPTGYDYRDLFAEYLAALAAEVGVRRGEVDLREAVRPLSAPHRHTGATPRPHGDPARALEDLKTVLPEPPAAVGWQPREKTTANSQRDRTVAAGGSALRRGRLDVEWKAYLLWGEPPAKDPGAARGDRSLTGAGATLAMAWAGMDAATAWRAIREAHPKAMTKARSHGFTWWHKYVWGPAAQDVATYTAHAGLPPAEEPAPAAGVLAAVAAARERLQAYAWTQPKRSRPALLAVGHVLLDRMAREGELRVPCPERNLVLDAGIRDRKTIRRALRALNGPVGQLHTDSLSPTDRATSSFEFEINPAPSQGGREIPPPVSHPPQGEKGLWLRLGPTAHCLWRALLPPEHSGLTTAEACREAALVDSPDTVPSKSTLRTAKGHLLALAEGGLVEVDAEGRWRATGARASAELAAAAEQTYAEAAVVVEAERTVYRAAATQDWLEGRRRAIEKQRARERAWWDALTPAEQQERVGRLRQLFAEMPVSHQTARKAELADRRTRAGLSEVEVYQTWLLSIPPDEYVERSRERATAFARLSPAEQGLRVAAWNRHRLRYGLMIQRPDHSPAASEFDALPDGTRARDEAFLERQLQFASLEASGRDDSSRTA